MGKGVVAGCKVHARHKGGHYLASVAETEEAEKEVVCLTTLTTLCAVELMGNDGLEEICFVEEIRHQFGQEIYAKTSPRRRRGEQTGENSTHLVNQERLMPHLKMEDGIIHGARMLVTNMRKPLINIAEMGVLPRIKPKLCSSPGDGHGSRDGRRNSALIVRASK